MGDVLSEILKTELFAVTEDGNSDKSEKTGWRRSAEQLHCLSTGETYAV